MRFIIISGLENTIGTFAYYLQLILQWFEKKNHN